MARRSKPPGGSVAWHRPPHEIRMIAGSDIVRVLLAKIGLDGHDRGVKVLARALRDAKMEVVYLGMRVTPQEVAVSALQEGVDVIGISLLSGAHMRLMGRLVKALEEEGILGDPLLLVGGTIPDADVEPLKQMGVDGVFPVGTPIQAIERFIRDNRRPRP